ncbi:MAG: hypothetical protein M1541_03880 [Acidobacteria bacterium]|nr:hypothetical protein [Acidobacteriota bacterium]
MKLLEHPLEEVAREVGLALVEVGHRQLRPARLPEKYYPLFEIGSLTWNA